MKTVKESANFIWSIADLLRGEKLNSDNYKTFYSSFSGPKIPTPHHQSNGINTRINSIYTKITFKSIF